MAKLFTIKFSDPSVNIKLTDSINPKTGDITYKEVRKRDFEIDTLKELFKLNSKTQDIEKFFECRDCLDQLKNLTDNDLEINFTESDLKFLKDGFGLTKWLPDKHLRIPRTDDMDDNFEFVLRQINKPTEKK